MQQAQETAAEAEAQGSRGLGLEVQGSVLQLQLVQGVLQIVVVVVLHRVEAAEHHGLGRPVAGQGEGRGVQSVGHRVAHLGVADVLDGRGEKAHLAGVQLFHGLGLGREHAHFGHVHHLAAAHHLHLGAAADHAVPHPDVGQGPLVAVEMGIEDKSGQGLLRVAGGRRDQVDDGLQDLVGALAGFG